MADTTAHGTPSGYSNGGCRCVECTATKQARFVALQKWEGRVTECLDDGFRAVLTDITTAGIEERVEFDLDEVSRDDLPLIVPGAVFYWSVGYRDEPTGERSRSSIIKFRRLPGWSARDLERITDRVTRQAMSDYRRARRVRSERYAPVRCSACRRLIEGCDGKWSDWMHSDTRSEFCADGSTLAGPERPDQIRFAPQRRLAS